MKINYNKLLKYIPLIFFDIGIYLLELLSELIFYSYNALKMYRVLCYTKLTLEVLPLLNPYDWPLCAIRVLTVPYFQFWYKFIPHLHLGRMAIDISLYVALELINFLIYKFAYIRLFALVILDNTIETIKHLKSLRGE